MDELEMQPLWQQHGQLGSGGGSSSCLADRLWLIDCPSVISHQISEVRVFKTLEIFELKFTVRQL